MFKYILTASLLACFATMSSAASFKYTSSSVSELDYFLQHWRAGFLFSADGSVSQESDVAIKFNINERIKKNSTYVYDASAKNWNVMILGGGNSSEYDPMSVLNFQRFSISITTDQDRQVVGWDFNVRAGSGIDEFVWYSSASSEQSSGSYEYFDEECVDRIGQEEDICLRNPIFRASGVGTWESVTPVPVPASMPLLAVGVFCLGAWRRKRA